MENIKFEMGNLDFSNVSDADLNPPKRLKQEGIFTFKLTSYEFSPVKKDGSRMELKVDAAGNRFHPLKVNLETEIDGNTYTANKLIFVPVDGDGSYLKIEGGKPSMIFATQTRDLIQALTKESISARNLGKHIARLNETLEAGIGDTIVAKNAKRSKESLVVTDNGDETKTYQIKLANGDLLETDEGDVAQADSYDGICAQYKAIKGQEFKAGTEITNFYLPKDD